MFGIFNYIKYGLKKKTMSVIDKPFFYEQIRKNGLFKELVQIQVDTIDALFYEFEQQKVTDIRQMAYIFATAYHECYDWINHPPHPRMTPMNELGGEKYLKAKKYYPYYGRGLSHITWPANYQKESKRLGIDLIKTPDQINDVKLAANSHVYCMMNGVYTTRKLSRYINGKLCDYVGARYVINGKDKAQEIADHAAKFENCLKFIK